MAQDFVDDCCQHSAVVSIGIALKAFVEEAFVALMEERRKLIPIWIKKIMLDK